MACCFRSCRNVECGMDATDCDIDEFFNNLWGKEVDGKGNETIIVPEGHPAFYFNLTLAEADDLVVDGSHDNLDLIRTATLSQKHKILTVTLNHNQTRQMANITITLSRNGTDIHYSFNFTATTILSSREKEENETLEVLDSYLASSNHTQPEEYLSLSIEGRPEVATQPNPPPDISEVTNFQSRSLLTVDGEWEEMKKFWVSTNIA